MTDLELSAALAKAIGWPDVDPLNGICWVLKVKDRWREFDYREWSVIGPIAERYDCFPYKNCSGLWEVYCSNAEGTATPQEAIALAVIGLVESEKPNAKLSGAEGVRS